MSNRAKIKRRRLGVPTEDELVPIVCTEDTFGAATERAMTTLEDVVGEQRASPTEIRVYRGPEKCRALLVALASHVDPEWRVEHARLVQTVDSLGEAAFVVLASCRRYRR